MKCLVCKKQLKKLQIKYCSNECYYKSMKGRSSHRKGKSNIYSKETLRKISESMKRYYQEHPELREKYSKMFIGKGNPNYNNGDKIKGKKNPMFGKSHTDSTREKIKKKAKNRKTSKETKAKMSKVHRKRYESKNERVKSSQPGKLNGMWKGGISFHPYGVEFNNCLKEKIRKRDNYTCSYCKKKWKVGMNKLSIHHIDYDKKNNNSDNLITLCVRCHMKTNSRREFWSSYFQKK